MCDIALSSNAAVVDPVLRTPARADGTVGEFRIFTGCSTFSVRVGGLSGYLRGRGLASDFDVEHRPFDCLPQYPDLPAHRCVPPYALVVASFPYSLVAT